MKLNKLGCSQPHKPGLSQRFHEQDIHSCALTQTLGYEPHGTFEAMRAAAAVSHSRTAPWVTSCMKAKGLQMSKGRGSVGSDGTTQFYWALLKSSAWALNLAMRKRSRMECLELLHRADFSPREQKGTAHKRQQQAVGGFV